MTTKLSTIGRKNIRRSLEVMKFKEEDILVHKEAGYLIRISSIWIEGGIYFTKSFNDNPVPLAVGQREIEDNFIMAPRAARILWERSQEENLTQES